MGPNFWAFLCEEPMKLFQQLLVAPAALGLMASGANAAELNINGVSEYAAADQVTSVTQFSDVYPTDWAYQALSNLVETYGSVAGMTDELKRLIREFETELAIIKGRVDGLEARVGELEATQFSTTTKLKGQADFFMGGVSYDDRGDCVHDDRSHKKVDLSVSGAGSSGCTDDAFVFN